jgi:alkylated DNA nucleotide flippase Atl1
VDSYYNPRIHTPTPMVIVLPVAEVATIENLAELSGLTPSELVSYAVQALMHGEEAGWVRLTASDEEVGDYRANGGIHTTLPLPSPN